MLGKFERFRHDRLSLKSQREAPLCFEVLERRLMLAAPDLVVQSVWTDPVTIVQGQSYSINATIQNVGDAPASAGSTANQDALIYVDNVLQGQVEYDNVAPGASIQVTVELIAPDSGPHTITVEADGNNEVNESNEGNNATSIAVTITPTRRITGSIIGASGSAHPVAIERFDSPGAAIDEALDSWIVVHGRNSAPHTEPIESLVRAFNSATNYQILTVDWSSAAANSLSISESNILPVATWTATALANYGFLGQSLNFIGHSFGTYVSFEVAKQIAGGVNSLVALEAAANVPGNSYNPNATVDFAAHTEHSMTLYSRDGFLGGISGNAVTSATADEAIVVANSDHNEVVDVFTNMLNGNGSCQVTNHFSLSRVASGAPGPWVPNQFNDRGQLAAGEEYEAVLSADPAGTVALSITYVPVAINLGTVDFAEFTNNLSCERWYKGTASQNGYLTFEAYFEHANGNVDLQMYNAQLELIASSNLNSDTERAETQSAAQGADYYLHVLGTNPQIDYRIVNMLSRAGTSVDVNGTSAADEFIFSASNSAGKSVITVNGVAYQFMPGEIDTIHIDGRGGTDSISLNGTSGDETAVLRAGNVSLSGDSYTAASVNVENVTVRGRGGNDRATLFDTDRDEVLRAYHDRVVMVGSGWLNRAAGFVAADAYASLGSDRAFVFDSSGNDTYRTYDDRVVMSGSGYANRAFGFGRTFGYSSLGDDTALMYDSVGSDTYRAYHDRVVMFGNGYFNWAKNFARTFGYGSGSGDKTVMFDSSGDDLYRTYHDRVVMSGAGYFNWAGGFARNFGYASGGNDQARMFDSSGNDLYRTYHDRVVMSGAGYFNWAGGFERSTSNASTGNDSARMYDSVGNDLVVAEDWGAYMVLAQDTYCESRGFDRIVAHSINGGQDRAEDHHVGYTFQLIGSWL